MTRNKCWTALCCSSSCVQTRKGAHTMAKERERERNKSWWNTGVWKDRPAATMEVELNRVLFFPISPQHAHSLAFSLCACNRLRKLCCAHRIKPERRCLLLFCVGSESEKCASCKQCCNNFRVLHACSAALLLCCSADLLLVPLLAVKH